MQKILLTGLLLWAAFAARAQTYYLDLSSQELSVPDRKVAVELVVDGRTGHPPIGIVYRGLSGKSAAVAFRNGLGPDLTTFVQAQLPARLTDHFVVLCLRSLHVGETLGGAKEQATAEMTADVYERLPTGYHFVQSVGAHASAYGAATSRHPGHMAELLSQCINQLAQANWPAVPSQPVRALADLPADVPAVLAAGGRRSAAVLREAPRRGLYYRFDQFLANRPDTLLGFAIDTSRYRHYKSRRATLKWLRVARVRPLVPNGMGGRMVPENLWGFSDGQQFFVQHNKQFFPLMRQGSCFTFVGEAPVDQQYARAEAEAQGRASLVGVASVGAVIDHTAEPTPYSLDLQTGATAPYPNLRIPARPDTAYLYVYHAPQATSSAPVKVYVDGQEKGELHPGQYLEVPWSRYGKSMYLCIGGIAVAHPCQYLVPNTAQLNYLKINPAKSAEPWQWVSPSQGSADLDELDKRNNSPGTK